MGDARAEVQDAISVTHNGALIGFLVERRHGFEAVSATGQQLGRFNTSEAGARALLHQAQCGGCSA